MVTICKSTQDKKKEFIEKDEKNFKPLLPVGDLIIRGRARISYIIGY
jgi:hypothetical protein